MLRKTVPSIGTNILKVYQDIKLKNVVIIVIFIWAIHLIEANVNSACGNDLNFPLQLTSVKINNDILYPQVISM